VAALRSSEKYAASVDGEQFLAPHSCALPHILGTYILGTQMLLGAERIGGDRCRSCCRRRSYLPTADCMQRPPSVMMRRAGAHASLRGIRGWLVALMLCAAPVHTQTIAPSLDSDQYGALLNTETTTPTPSGELPTVRQSDTPPAGSNFHAGQHQ